jgi:Ca-activated chloride channel family protein
LVYDEVDLDETTLKSIAGMASGQYFRAADSEQLSEIYDIIDRQEKTEVKMKEFFHFRELYYYFLVPALVLLGLEILLKSTVLRVIP